MGDWREVQSWWGDSAHRSRQRRRLDSSLRTSGLRKKGTQIGKGVEGGWCKRERVWSYIWEVWVGGRWEMRILVSRGSTVTRLWMRRNYEQ